MVGTTPTTTMSTKVTLPSPFLFSLLPRLVPDPIEDAGPRADFGERDREAFENNIPGSQPGIKGASPNTRSGSKNPSGISSQPAFRSSSNGKIPARLRRVS